MGFKWQTLTKVLRSKPSCFVDSYKVALIYMRIKKLYMRIKKHVIETKNMR